MSAVRWEGAKVLVTGGAGFIGSHLVDRLLGPGRAGRVVVLDDLSNGSTDNLDLHRDDSRFELLVGDVRDARTVGAATDGVDVVFHLACLGVRHSLHDPMENHDVNATGTLVLLEAARAAAVSRFVHVSTSEVFGTAQWAPMDERHPTWPETVYGGAKLAGEAYARAAHRTHGLPVTVVRPFNNYGPRSHFEGDSGEVIPRTMVRALCGLPPLVFGDGLQTRDFLHVSDTARALVALAECAPAVGRTVNVGFGDETSIDALVRAVTAAVGRSDLQPERLPDRPGDVRRLWVDNTCVEELVGFRPTVRLEDGLAELVTWFRGSASTPEQMLAAVSERNWLPAPMPVGAQA